MDREAFQLVDPLFFDVPYGKRQTRFTDFAVHPPTHWRTTRIGPWLAHTPHSITDEAGWKLHISATSHGAADVLAITSRYLHENGLAYKHLANPAVLTFSNTKYSPRSSSGKFITVYPLPDQNPTSIADDLADALQGFDGPRILSDLRWRRSNVYLRYGAWRPRPLAGEGGRIGYGMTTSLGDRIPDSRASFSPPSWLPRCPRIVRECEQQASDTFAEFPYESIRLLHSSNSGGVYSAARRGDGRRVILKEARPWAGVDGRGDDAVRRLHVEASNLQALQALPVVPRFHRIFEAGGHTFLEMSHQPGISLHQWRAEHFPLTSHSPARSAIAKYAGAVMTIVQNLSDAIEALHGLGWAFNDLHLTNVLVRDDLGVSLVDLEAAERLTSTLQPRLGHPLYNPAGSRGTARDLHALEMLTLDLHAPHAALVALDPGKLPSVRTYVESRFTARVHPLALQGQKTGLTPSPDLRVPTSERWSGDRSSLIEAILVSASPSREDRLFPGDPEQFSIAPYAFRHGAGGVLWALRHAGRQIPEGLVKWFVASVLDDRDGRLGLFDGLAGAVHVLRVLGEHGSAEACCQELASRISEVRYAGWSFHSGVAGILCTLADELRYDRSHRLETVVRALALDLANRPGTPGAGLMFGLTGEAVALAYTSRRLKEPELASAARVRLDSALKLLARSSDGSLQVKQKRRLNPYLEDGAAGVLLALQQICHSTALPRPYAEGLIRACSTDFVLEPQMMNGRAGHLLSLASLAGLRNDRLIAKMRRHLGSLTEYAISCQGAGPSLARD